MVWNIATVALGGHPSNKIQATLVSMPCTRRGKPVDSWFLATGMDALCIEAGLVEYLDAGRKICAACFGDLQFAAISVKS